MKTAIVTGGCRGIGLATTEIFLEQGWAVAVVDRDADELRSAAQGRENVLAVEADSDSMGRWWKDRYSLDEYHQRLQVVPDCRTAVVQNAGHMLHHDQPQAVAALIEDFLR